MRAVKAKTPYGCFFRGTGAPARVSPVVAMNLDAFCAMRPKPRVAASRCNTANSFNAAGAGALPERRPISSACMADIVLRQQNPEPAQAVLILRLRPERGECVQRSGQLTTTAGAVAELIEKNIGLAYSNQRSQAARDAILFRRNGRPAFWVKPASPPGKTLSLPAATAIRKFVGHEESKTRFPCVNPLQQSLFSTRESFCLSFPRYVVGGRES